MDIGFEINYMHSMTIDTNPQGEEDWAYVGPGIDSIAWAGSDNLNEKAYWNMGGASSKNVTGVNVGWDVTGDRLRGDKAQDYVASLAYTKGSERKTRVRLTNPDGEVLEWPVVITNIKGHTPDGESTANVPFAFSVTCEGDPVQVSPAEGTDLPETVTVADVEVAVGTTAQITPTVTPSTASDWCFYAVNEAGREVCSVDAEGNVVGLKAGEAVITVKCATRPSVNAQAKVTVTA